MSQLISSTTAIFDQQCSGVVSGDRVFKSKMKDALRRATHSAGLWMFILMLVFGLSENTFSQGTIRGKVKDKVTNEPMVGATLIISGTQMGAITNLEGAYTISNVPAGKHTLICSYISYEKENREITVTHKDTIESNFNLTTSTTALKGILVRARRNPESEDLQIMKQKESVIVTQSIGAQELSRKGAGDAEDAVKKISGISKQEGVKNVFVRGLGDRYNTTTLNGFVIPSEDPEYKNISLDFFSTDMIQSVSVSKVFSASMMGDVGGALIDIQTKVLTEDKMFEVGVSTSMNSLIPGKQFLLPDGFNRLGYATASFTSNEELTEYTSTTTLDPKEVGIPLNYNLSLAWGRSFAKKHKFYLLGVMGNSYQYEEGVSRDITATNATKPFQDFSYEKYQRSTNHLVLANLEMDFDKHKFSVVSLYLHTGSSYAAEFYGRHVETFQIAEDYNSEGLTRRLQINDNTIFINQLIWKGDLSKRWKYYAGASINHVSGNEPDRRIFRFPSVGNGNVQLAVGESRHQRFTGNITETALIPKINAQYKLSAKHNQISYLDFGFDARISAKDFSAPFYNHVWLPGTQTPPIFDKNSTGLDTVFNQEGLSDGLFKMEHFHDKYDVTRLVYGSYADLVYQLGPRLTLNAGIRLEMVSTIINYEVNRGANIGSDTLQGVFMSPSMNLKYVLNDKNHLRIGTSKTYTLPQDREISPFVFLGFDGIENGNPDLEISTNYNADIKWDHYLSSRETFSINGYFKYILKPIARVDQGNSAGLKTFDNVSDYAIAAGVEAEFRKRVYSIKSKHFFDLGVNASYIYSKINLDPQYFVQNTTSTLEGAAPYIVNADLTYRFVTAKHSITSALVFNYMSDKVHTIGTRGYNNLIEEEVSSLDLIGSFKLTKHLAISLKAMNLLNPDFKLTREGTDDTNESGVVIRSYKKGIHMSFGISYKM